MLGLAVTHCFGVSIQDQADTIRGICIGISAHQKLELLSSLVKLLGYESLAVFGDCFDEVCQTRPSTVKPSCWRLQAAFACSVQRNKDSILASASVHT